MPFGIHEVIEDDTSERATWWIVYDEYESDPHVIAVRTTSVAFAEDIWRMQERNCRTYDFNLIVDALEGDPRVRP